MRGDLQCTVLYRCSIESLKGADKGILVLVFMSTLASYDHHSHNRTQIGEKDIPHLCL